MLFFGIPMLKMPAPIALLSKHGATDMAAHALYFDSLNYLPYVKPWLIVTKDDVVTDRFDGAQYKEAQEFSQRLATAWDPTARLYEVDSQVIPSPIDQFISSAIQHLNQIPLMRFLSLDIANIFFPARSIISSFVFA